MDITDFIYYLVGGIAVLLNIGCIIWPEAMIRFNEYWYNRIGLKTKKDNPNRSPQMVRFLGLFSLAIILLLAIVVVLNARGWN